MALLDFDYLLLDQGEESLQSENTGGVITVKLIYPRQPAIGDIGPDGIVGPTGNMYAEQKRRLFSTKACLVSERLRSASALYMERHDVSKQDYEFNISFATPMEIGKIVKFASACETKTWSPTYQTVFKTQRKVYSDSFIKHYSITFPYHGLSKAEYYSLFLSNGRALIHLKGDSFRLAGDEEVVDPEDMVGIESSSVVDKDLVKSLRFTINRSVFQERFTQIWESFDIIGFAF